ncbi:MAG: DUF2946 domain-containing protein [Rhodobacteraceae bacterium]|nr:DUF2946 domain-containing protein [Paracoccaceae bacterium]
MPIILVLVALTVGGMIPIGWMPDARADGKVLLVICTPEGVQETWVDLDGDPSEQAPEHADQRVCPFSALSFATLEMHPGTALPVEYRIGALWTHEPFTHHTAGFHWRYDARGPPAHS